MRGFEDYFQHNIFHVYYNPLKLISKKRSFVSTTIYFLLEMYSILGTTAEEIKKKKRKRIQRTYDITSQQRSIELIRGNCSN